MSRKSLKTLKKKLQQLKAELEIADRSNDAERAFWTEDQIYQIEQQIKDRTKA